MVQRLTLLPPEVYPDDPWALLEEAYSPDFLYLTETILALSNGHIGIRGTLYEGSPTHFHGTFVNGFHETWPIVHPENAFGLATVGQTIVIAPDATVLMVSVDGERFDPAAASSFRRWLDFRTGTIERVVEWRTTSGVTVSMWNRRLVSLVHRELAAFSTRIEVDRPAHVVVGSRLINRQDAPTEGLAEDDPRRAARLPHRVLIPVTTAATGYRIVSTWVTANSGMGLVCGLDHRVSPEPDELEDGGTTDDHGFTFGFFATPAHPVEVEKYAAYADSPSRPGPDVIARAEEALTAAHALAFEGLMSEQRAALDRFWEDADIEVDAGPDVQRAIRWTLFQLHQGSALLGGLSIPAKGLTGQAYDGHYFWDTEIFLFPFLIYTNPGAAARILRFRYSMLDKARRRAADLAMGGALFPWRTINGHEASAYFLAGTAQYHINADIVHGLRKYVEVTGDHELLWEMGVELAVETARMWYDLGFERAGRFHIHGVTGPDEYTALVDDNAYTNAMARMNMRYAAEAVDLMGHEAPDRLAELTTRLGLSGEEVTAWRLAADSMYVPHDLELGITPQDAAFLTREPWDFAGTPPSMYPLLLHFHPLVIYRYQVLKQADVVLADFLLGNEFAPELKRANFEYYDPITTGDSSLSACVQSIMAAEIGADATALEHFLHALFMDLADLAGNTTDGVHMASAGGVWMALVYGFGGLRDHGGRITLDPRLPKEWARLRFRLAIRSSRLTVEVEPRLARLLVSGEPLEVIVRGETIELFPDAPVTCHW